MATVHHAAFLAVMGVLLQSHIATADLVHFPFNGTGAACNEIVCGRGSCVPLINTTFGFECVCDPGWRQARPDGDQYLNFLPCLIPNCKFFVLVFT
ncbi:UNVERIFIED_CONTAM: hypothetical protein Scaly_2494300 [Sesamum calycinum]|uniref:EGF-like domain-containing protein n=1 Tax=Sesamum calycinum TaxID=2727403 RepID=A0AAW2LRZ3_9LAMI